MKTAVKATGVQFELVGKNVRSVYHQLDGQVVLADTCQCPVFYEPAFRVQRSVSCPIDQHSTEAKQQEVLG